MKDYVNGFVTGLVLGLSLAVLILAPTPSGATGCAVPAALLNGGAR